MKLMMPLHGGGEIDHLMAEPIPTTYPVWMVGIYVDAPRGTVQCQPTCSQIDAVLTDQNGNTVWSISGAASREAWSKAFFDTYNPIVHQPNGKLYQSL